MNAKDEYLKHAVELLGTIATIDKNYRLGKISKEKAWELTQKVLENES